MTGSMLKDHWLEALAVGATAVDAAARAHALAPDVVAARRGRLRADRAWVESVEWPDVVGTPPGMLVRIEAGGDLGLGAVKRAA
jgi:hypothetical protein